jgi:hypothetical protein
MRLALLDYYSSPAPVILEEFDITHIAAQCINRAVAAGIL